MLSLWGCALLGPTESERLAAAIISRHPDVVIRTESRPGNFLDRPEVAFYVRADTDRAALHEMACVEVPRLTMEMDLDGNIGVGFHSEDGTLIDGGSSSGCANP
jgi:hypothetical protein